MKTGRFDKVYDCLQSISSGKIKINDSTVLNPNYFFNSKKSVVKIDAVKIKSVKKLYFILNKPAGYLSQKSDNEKTIYDIIERLNISKEEKNSLFAVGRLDRDTEGLMILTNDGRLSNKIMNSENEIAKKYYALLEKPVDKNQIKKIEKGIEIEIDNDIYKTKPCKIKVTGEKEVYISVSEGRKRQIRKIFEKINNRVIYLKRLSIGGLQLDKLKVGELMEMKRDEMYKNINP